MNATPIHTWTAKVWVKLPGAGDTKRLITVPVQAPTLYEAKLIVNGQYGSGNVLAVY